MVISSPNPFLLPLPIHYVKLIAWFNEVGREDVGLVGGKGANLGELSRNGVPVPPGFIVTAEAFRKFLEYTGLGERIYPLLDNLDVEDTVRLQEVSREIMQMIESSEVPDFIENEIRIAYRRLGEIVSGSIIGKDVWVAVRSSATAEDLPEASFAGQQATFLFVRGPESVVEHVKKCWASLFTARAIYYRVKQGFPHRKVSIAVVVQKMVNSQVSGVMFTSHPVTGEPVILIEAAYGLGEAVVSGSVTPDEYVVDKKTLKIIDKKVVSQERMIVQKPGGGTEWVPVPPEKRSQQKLPDNKIVELAKIGRMIEDIYGFPQDIEWALEEGRLYIVQSRAITTIGRKEKDVEVREEEEENNEEVLVRGIPASPGIGRGRVVIVKDMSDLSRVKKGDVLVTTMTTPDMVPAMEKASAIVTDEGGMTSHAAIVSRELGIPAVVGTGNATKVLKEGMRVTVDGYKGVVYKGDVETEEHREIKTVEVVRTALRYPTATLVKVNVSMPEAAERAARTNADGVGLLRAEHMITSTGKHPLWFVRNGRLEELKEVVKKGIRKVAEKFYPKPVWYRTFDARTDEFRHLEGGEEEPEEDNPMLGWHGIRRSLSVPDLLRTEFLAIKELHEEGLTNVSVMLPFVSLVDEYIEAERLAREVGYRGEIGIMVETPASALRIEDFLEAGASFVSFGTNDLTQLTLGVDRNNAYIQYLFNEMHPAVLDLIHFVIERAKEYGVETSICGQAGSNPDMVRRLVRMGIDSVSANIDAVDMIREVVYREERRIMLERLRDLPRDV